MRNNTLVNNQCILVKSKMPLKLDDDDDDDDDDSINNSCSNASGDSSSSSDGRAVSSRKVGVAPSPP